MADTLLRTIHEHIEAVAGAPAGVLVHHVVAEPPVATMGDFASNIALVAASHFKKKPFELAQEIAEKLASDEFFAEVMVAAPGFINVRLGESALENALGQTHHGFKKNATGKYARVEFISANPTGPLHIGNARGGPLGDTIANVLAKNGYTVLREYIDNDRGNQVLEFGKSIVGTGSQYQGTYVQDLKRKVGKVGDARQAGERAVKLMLEEIMADCRAMGITFDCVVHESELQKQAPAILKELEQRKLLKKQDGAVWFSPPGGDDLKAVVQKSDGSYLYFTADVVYHREKFQSGYDLVVDVLGANTSGHVPKLEALTTIYGFDPEKFKILLYQFVRVKRGNEIVKMSKRAGNFVTAREVLDEVGKDAFRFFMLLHDPNTHMDFDLELAKAKTKENPVYYVQYAAVRCKSILKKIQKSKFKNQNSKIKIANDKERQLALAIVQLPDLIQEIGESLTVHRLAHYALNVAGLFHL
ncbi:arginine--tRNA ligase [Candidatus Berkelbacteria bacterium]|nr:arginine--tRNA ligase [Candidatus Berkelbacteria bacterium]